MRVWAAAVRTTFERGALGLFILFALVNVLLAYGPWGLGIKVFLFVVGMALPLVWALKAPGNVRKGKAKPLYRAESFKNPPAWIWVCMFLLAVGLRLFQTSVPGYWPTYDDGLAYYSVDLKDRGAVEFFYTKAQHPPLFNWSLALFFKLVTPSLFSLWLFPAILSIAVLFLAYSIGRRRFSGSFTFLCCSLMAFGFWPLFTGKLCLYMILLLFWEMLVFLLLAVCLERPTRGAMIALSISLALGFWVDITGPLVALMALAAVRSMKGWTRRSFWGFLAPILGSAIVFGIVSLMEGNGGHITELLKIRGAMDALVRLWDFASNFTALLWGCDLQNSYGPLWGGMLDPIVGSFFLVGLLEGWRTRKSPWALWALSAFFLFMLPGAVARGFDIFRNEQALPLVLFLAALGIQRVLLSIPTKGRVLFLSGVLLLSIPLDLGHLWLSYGKKPWLGSGTPPLDVNTSNFTRAFDLLCREREKSGPGALLFDLKPNIANQTLSLATYPFNAARNPGIDPEKAAWMACLVDLNYEPFLRKRFPDANWTRIFSADPSDRSPEGNWLLGIIPLTHQRREVLRKWTQADNEFRIVIWTAANSPDSVGRKKVFELLPGLRQHVQGDPLLESLYSEMRLAFHGWETAFGDKDHSAHYPAAREAVLEGLRDGYPTAFFYNKWGLFLALEGDHSGARKAFLEAIRSPVNFTGAKKNLAELEKQGRGRSGRSW